MQKQNELIVRAKKLITGNPITADELQEVQNVLNITLPEDFVYINKVISYEYFSSFSFLNFGDTEDGSVIYVSLGAYDFFRGDPNYCILYEDDAGVIIMNNCSREGCLIYWCAIEDVENILNNQPLLYAYEYFPSFTDFFEYLLDEEEKIQATLNLEHKDL